MLKSPCYQQWYHTIFRRNKRCTLVDWLGWDPSEAFLIGTSEVYSPIVSEDMSIFFLTQQWREAIGSKRKEKIKESHRCTRYWVWLPVIFVHLGKALWICRRRESGLRLYYYCWRSPQNSACIDCSTRSAGMSTGQLQHASFKEWWRSGRESVHHIICPRGSLHYDLGTFLSPQCSLYCTWIGWDFLKTQFVNYSTAHDAAMLFWKAKALIERSQSLIPDVMEAARRLFVYWLMRENRLQVFYGQTDGEP